MRYSERERLKRKRQNRQAQIQGLVGFLKKAKWFIGLGFWILGWIFIPMFLQVSIIFMIGFLSGLFFVNVYKDEFIDALFPKVFQSKCDKIVIEDNNENSEISTMEIPIYKTQHPFIFRLRGKPNFLKRVKNHYTEPEKAVQPEIEILETITI